MSDRQPRKFAFANSTGFRLAIGFGVVVCVFGAALLISLYNLEKLKKTAEDARVGQEIRRETRKIADIGEELYQIQGDFAAADEPDPGKVATFGARYDEMQNYLEGLYVKPLGEHERLQIIGLARQGGKLREIFRYRVVEAKMRLHRGEGTPEELSAALAASRDVIAEMQRLNSNLRRILELKTHNAEYEAELIWQLSLTVSRATIGVALVVSLVVIYITHRAIMRPISRLLDGTKSLADGDLTRRIEVPASGEFRELAESFNRMTYALQVNQRKLIETERLATLGRFAAGIAHEINNPIAVILGYAKPMIKQLPPDATELEALKAIEEEARHCKNIVQGLLDIARPADEARSEAINPKELVSEVIALARTLGLTERVTVETAVVDRDLAMTLGRSRLRQIMLNIVSNALEELQDIGDGKLRIEGYVTDDAEAAAAQSLVLRFIDNGPGIPQEHLDQLPEPFFTTKSKGTGLGLAITYSIVSAHGGHVDVTSSEGEGATFVVSLPLAAQT